MTVYHVTGWNKHYENNRSRKVINLAWVPVPNHHDGERYTAIWHEKNGAELFAAWILILQVASKCHPRGSLVRSNGQPHTALSLAVKTRARSDIFESALNYYSNNGWLTTELNEQQEIEYQRQETATVVPPSCQSGDEEGKGREQKEVKEEGAASPPTSSDVEWVAELRTLPAYEHCDVADEYQKCLLHYKAKRRKTTRSLFLGWLGRIEKPLGAIVPPIKPTAKEPKDWQKKLLLVHPAAEYNGPWVTLPDSTKAAILALP